MGSPRKVVTATRRGFRPHLGYLALAAVVVGGFCWLVIIASVPSAVDVARQNVATAFHAARYRAAHTGRSHFIVFSTQSEPTFIAVHEDINGDGVYQGDFEIDSDDSDGAVTGLSWRVPKDMSLEYAPRWVSISPQGTLRFSDGFQEVNLRGMWGGAARFPPPPGDIVLTHKEGYMVCFNLDRPSGGISEFVVLVKR